ncbi:MAG: DMT family transporter [bacterium]|nr:DMT family transporter [bacterium]
MGELFALSCAMVWAVAVILFRKSGTTIAPLALNLFRVGITSVVFFISLKIMRVPIFGQAPWQDYLILMSSGIIAIAIADTLFHMSLNRVGAGINAIVDSLYSPSVLLFAFIMLGERFTLVQLLGMFLMVGGLIISTRVQPPPGSSRKQLLTGIALGVGAMACLGFGIVLAKQVLDGANVLWATSIRQFGSLLVLIPITLIRKDRKKIWGVFIPAAHWKFSLPGTLLGSYFALLLWIAGMKLLPAGKAALLNQTSTIYLLILATIVLKEPFGRRKALSASLAVIGVFLVL